MGRKAEPSSTSVAAIRAWFGLTQAELAAWLGVTRPMVSIIERRQATLTGERIVRLAPLLRLLPPPYGFGAPESPLPEAPVAPLPVPAPGAGLQTPPAPPPATALTPTLTRQFERRLRDCRHQILLAAREQVARQHQQRLADRWARALPALRAALPPDALRAHRLLDRREAQLAEAAAPGGPLHPVALAELALRRALLEAEAAHLAEWLGN